MCRCSHCLGDGLHLLRPSSTQSSPSSPLSSSCPLHPTPTHTITTHSLLNLPNVSLPFPLHATPTNLSLSFLPPLPPTQTPPLPPSHPNELPSSPPSSHLSHHTKRTPPSQRSETPHLVAGAGSGGGGGGGDGGGGGGGVVVVSDAVIWHMSMSTPAKDLIVMQTTRCRVACKTPGDPSHPGALDDPQLLAIEVSQKLS